MPMLALVVALLLISKGAPCSVIVMVTFALLCGMTGDLFLLDATNNTRFLAGTLSFFVGHLFYLSLFSTGMLLLPWWSWLIYLPIAGAFTFCTWSTISKPSGVTGVFICAYTFILTLLLFSGIAAVITRSTSGAWYILIGAILFICSDGILSFTLYQKDFPGSRFVIMATYITAQIMLALAVVHPVL